MSATAEGLFDLVVASEDEHPSFVGLRTQGTSEPARWMMEQVFEKFVDCDGNFVQQFQSSGFDSRCFELYLFAYLYFSGFEVEQAHPSPDFVVTREGITTCIEATTVNPPTAGVLAELGKKIVDLSGPELAEYRRHELPLRFGSPLFSKLQKRYWEIPHCKERPFVLAIQAFHDDNALALSDSALTSYLYGVTHSSSFDSQGSLEIDFEKIYSHVVGEKEVPSSFFGQPDSEHVSAVMFTNAGTYAKFTRMGYQCGIGADTLAISRVGYCFNRLPDARDATYFSYDLDEPPLVESWGQGLVVLHNPNCLHPLPITYFPHSAQTVFEDGKPLTTFEGWHPFSSKTFNMDLGDLKRKMAKMPPPRVPCVAIGAITKDEFHEMLGFQEPLGVSEDGWFTDESDAFLGVIVYDEIDADWGYVVLARDQFFQFRAIELDSSLPTRDAARSELQRQMAKLLAGPQRLFPQEEE